MSIFDDRCKQRTLVSTRLTMALADLGSVDTMGADMLLKGMCELSHASGQCDVFGFKDTRGKLIDLVKQCLRLYTQREYMSGLEFRSSARAIYDDVLKTKQSLCVE